LFNPAVQRQQTLKQAVSFEGVGLHSGNRVKMAFLPAPPKTGLRFRRVDLEGKPEIEARVENVAETNRSTTLAKGNIRIHTVEHVLSALAGSGIDNAFIELDANEPPIADGSSRTYGQMIRDAGTTAQPDPREPYTVAAPLLVEQGDSFMSVHPCDRFKITCTSSDRQGRFTQFYSVDVTPEAWEKELSHARTFCFFEEIEFLIKNGLIKGGSLENAVVIRDDAVLTTEPLRYPEEFVRHKILDIVGDLALVGRPLLAHVTAVKPSHGLNCELARQLVAQMQKPAPSALFTPPAPAVLPTPAPATPPAQPAGKAPPVHDVNQVMKLLPHRYPFLMVDRITRLEGNKITGVKNVSINEPFFQGHFPGHPIMPGVLQLEAMAQVAGILMLNQPDTKSGQPAYFMAAESVKWRKPVLPGDVLTIDIEMIKRRGRIGKAKGTCSVDGDVVSEAEVTFMILE
jgi:UDP-3-O-[3-hydroxymyristoyl] N-acetylglucosamine deacetylase/3-hydroxyacyl-[acyl-carrier-protein] dehydratase